MAGLINPTSLLEVELVQSAGDDMGIVRAARVSTGLDTDEVSEAKKIGMINYLMKKRHGSPFEHNTMTFRVKAPIFVVREWFRHRVGWSYNEISGRYAELAPNFYVYPAERPLEQQGSSAHPNLVMGEEGARIEGNEVMLESYQQSWDAYQRLIELGWALEAARAVLPVGIFTEFYATCNTRSLMAFLSLRIDSENNTYETKPQWEIQRVAELMEEYFNLLFPVTHAAFNTHGRVSP